MNAKLEKTHRLIVACLLMLAAAAASAVPMSDLYTAEVNYDAQRRDGRERAYAEALTTVLRRVTPNVAEARGIAAFAQPGQFVLGFREAGDQRMWVTLDGVAISAELQGAGLPVWGSDRPLTLVWLAVERANGEREIVALDGSTDSPDPLLLGIRAALVSSASAQGVPGSLPVLDARDREAVQDSDIWGGFTDIVVAASRRYRADSVLIGRIRASQPTDVRWRWAVAGESEQFRGDIGTAVGRVARRLLDQFASSPGGSLGVTLHVVGIDGMKGFATISRLLGSQSLIERADVIAMRADAAVFRIDALTSRDRLAALLERINLETISPPAAALSIDDPFANADLHVRMNADSGSLRR